MKRLEGVVRPYAWGSRVAIAAMQGRPVPSAHPEAELWFGSHPAGPARCVGADGAPHTDLLTAIDANPVDALGSVSYTHLTLPTSDPV